MPDMLQVVPTPNSLWAHTSKFDGCNIRTKLTEHIRAERVSVGVSASSSKQQILSVVQQDWEKKGQKNRLKMIEIHVSAASYFHLIQLQSWGHDSPFHQHSCCLSLPRPKLGGCQFLMSCFCIFHVFSAVEIEKPCHHCNPLESSSITLNKLLWGQRNQFSRGLCQLSCRCWAHKNFSQLI